MAAGKFSITLDANKRKTLEELAMKNYRSLNGEINMAIDLYIQQATMGAVFVQAPSVVPVAPVVQEVEVKEDKPMTIDDFGDEEVDEF